MIAVIKKSCARGEIVAPPSKSMAHRHIICAAFSDGESLVENVDFSQDILATLDCIKALGATVQKSDTSVLIKGIDYKTAPLCGDFYCRESGSTMRFFMGIAMCLGIKGRFFGSETLRNRPFGIYEDLCRENGMTFERNEDHILVEGRLNAGTYKIPGNVSSQFITGLLFALPLLDSDSTIELIPPVESRSYLDLTFKAMSDAGVTLKWADDNTISVEGEQKYIGRKIAVEGDFSNSAFLDAFNTIGGSVKTLGLSDDSLQGDRIYREYFKKLQAETPTIDISNCPDLGPVLFCVAAANNGALFTGTRRLKMKESDRGAVMCEELKKLSVETFMEDNSIRIGKYDGSYPKEDICGHNDHRIVMSFAFLLSLSGGRILEAQAVNKSYPGFFSDIKNLGIEVDLEDE